MSGLPTSSEVSLHNTGADPAWPSKLPACPSSRTGHLWSCPHIAQPVCAYPQHGQRAHCRRLHAPENGQILAADAWGWGSWGLARNDLHSSSDQSLTMPWAPLQQKLGHPTPGHPVTEGLLSSRLGKGFCPDYKHGQSVLQKGSCCSWGTYILGLSATRHGPVVCWGLHHSHRPSTCGLSLPPRVKSKNSNVGAFLGRLHCTADLWR